MNDRANTFFDTDLQIHRLSADPAVRRAARKEFEESRPSAMSAFSMVELKGNYIQSLVLLSRKIGDSDTFSEAFSRVQNSGGRKASLMLAQLVCWLDGPDFELNPWVEAQRVLLTHLDAQIEASWEQFLNSVDVLFDDFKCTRASEPPEIEAGRWVARIPKCQDNNRRCKILSFMRQHTLELERLVEAISAMEPGGKTNELNKITKVARRTLNEKTFRWEGNTCRQVGDLLIGLQSKVGKELVSSNRREHGPMHEPLGYNFREFPIASIRSK